MHRTNFILASAIALAALPVLAEIKPSRSECIIGFRLDWSEVSADRRDVTNSMAVVNRTERVDSLAGLQFGRDQSELYLIFKNDCERKEKLALEQIAYWRKADLELPRFDRIEDPIVPSTKTIDIGGPYWRDGQPEGIPPERFHAEPEDQSI